MFTVADEWPLLPVVYNVQYQSRPPKKYLKEAAARARDAASQARALAARDESSHNPVSESGNPAPETRPSPSDNLPRAPVIEIDISSESECGYDGGVEMGISTDDDEEAGSVSDAGCESVVEFDEDDVREMKEKGLRVIACAETQPVKSLYSELKVGLEKKEWKKIEANRSLGYNGQSERSQQRRAAAARKQEEERARARNS